MRRRWLLGALTASVLLVAGALAAGYLWLKSEIAAPGPLAAETIQVIPRGQGIEATAAALHAAGVIRHPWLLPIASRLEPGASIKAGEYAFAPGISLHELLVQLRAGRTLVRRLTIPEGLTTREVLDLVSAAPALDGTVPPGLAEGSLLPETYHYSRGDSRAAMVVRMRDAMDKALAEAWAKRKPDLPLKTAAEALVLASIIEKETGKPEERAHIAGVYINRLRLGMRLQADPTVIHALTGGARELGRDLLRTDLDVVSPYNTYRVVGLPPGPIANPGLAALNAATRPEETKAIYFVADGTGGHAFAETLAEHNRNVAKLRRLKAGDQ
jgi:UPF0755 protein